MEHVQLKTK